MATPKQHTAEWNLDWLVPIGALIFIVFLAFNFVGNRPFGLDNDATCQWVEMGLALGLFGVISWGYWLSQQKRGGHRLVLRDRLLVVIGLGGFLAYFNFGHLHFHNLVHVWDTYHYHIGAKYFPELNYERLYDCTEVVGLESGRKDEVARRTVTDLRTNIIVKTDDLIANPEEHCKRYFTPERWKQFSGDINSYRSWVNEQRWTDILHDHGYNATPVWTLMGMFWTNTLSAFDGLVTPDIPSWTNPKTGTTYPSTAESVIAARSGEHSVLGRYNEGLRLRGYDPPFTSYLGGRHVILLNLLDPIFLALTCLIVWWAFGPRAFAVAAVVLGCNFPNRFYWTGGAFLRHDWLFFLIASICLLKKERPVLAGAAFAYTTLLRLFPGLVALGPALAAVEYYRVHRTLDRQFVKFVASGAVSSALLVGASFFFVNSASVTSYQAVVKAVGDDAVVEVARVDTKTGAPVTWLRAPRFELMTGPAGLSESVDADGALTLSGRTSSDQSGAEPLRVKLAGGDSLEVPVAAGESAGQVAQHLVDAVAALAAKDKGGGPETWQRFAQNTVKHSNTPLTNHMGLRTLLSWRPSTVGIRMVERGAIDPWAKWKQTRLEKWHEAQPLFVLLMLAAMVLVYLALRHTGASVWFGAALGIGFIPFGAELTNYYYCFLIGIGVLHVLKREVGLLIAALAAVTLFINFAPLPFMSRELDEQYVAMTVASLLAVTGIWWCFTKWGSVNCAEPEPPVAPETFAWSAPPAVAEGPKKKRKREGR